MMRSVLPLVLLVTVATACGGDKDPTGPPPPPAAPVPATIVIAGLPADVVVGDTIQLSATVRTSNGTVLNNVTVTWTSLDGSRLQGLAAGRFVIAHPLPAYEPLAPH
jgi:hypothetical protein